MSGQIYVTWREAKAKAPLDSSLPLLRPIHPGDICTPADLTGRGGPIESGPEFRPLDNEQQRINKLIEDIRADADAELEKALATPSDIAVELLLGEAKLAEKLGVEAVRKAAKLINFLRSVGDNIETIEAVAAFVDAVFDDLQRELTNNQSPEEDLELVEPEEPPDEGADADASTGSTLHLPAKEISHAAFS
jgi:hypothetical protein